MKYIYNLSLFLLMLFSSCKEDVLIPEGNVEIAQSFKSLDELALSQVDVDSEKGSYVLKIFSNDKWTLSSSEDWCVVNTSEGEKYTQIEISFEKNPKNIERTASLYFSVTDMDKIYEVKVSQKASETELAFGTDLIKFSIKGGEEDALLMTNAPDIDYFLINEDGSTYTDSWCEIIENTESENISLYVKVLGNDTGNDRKVILKVSVNDKEISLPIEQLGDFTAPVVTLDDNYNFNINWVGEIGIDKYKLYYSKNNDFTTDEGTIEIESDINTYDLSDIYPDYIGPLYLKLAAVMDLGTSDTEKESDIIETHTRFDISSGDGTSSGSPYMISKPRHLKNVSKDLGAYYKQTADIDLSGIADWDHISTEVSTSNDYQGEFVGEYDGDNKKILNMTLNRGVRNYCGLFSRIGVNGVVKNISLENVKITASKISGGIAGINSGTIDNCHIIGEESNLLSTLSNNSQEACLGGIAGQNNGTIGNCSNSANISVTEADGKIGNCVGGIVGKIKGETSSAISIYNCNNSGEILGGTQIGGIIGEFKTGTLSSSTPDIKNCYNTGNIRSISTNSQAGGIIGRIFSAVTVNGCWNKGVVESVGSAGGIAGRFGTANNGVVEISNCYNRGEIKTTTDTNVANNNAGGILARVASDNGTLNLKYCYNTGVVSASSGAAEGVICNKITNSATINITSCVALDENGCKQSNTTEFSNITNVSRNNINSQSSYTDWDFTSTWEFGEEFLKLKNMPE